MNDNNKPVPEEISEQLDTEIEETVQDWAENPAGANYTNLDQRIDEGLRRKIAGWVGAEEASWEIIGEKMDASTRAQIAGWVGAENDADWDTIASRIENRVRHGVAQLVKVQQEDDTTDISWNNIGSKIDRDVRGWMAALVGMEDQEPDWEAIGDQVVNHVQAAFDKGAAAFRDGETEPVDSQPEKMPVEGE